MQHTTTGHRSEARLSVLADQNPEWRPWLSLLDEVAREVRSGAWNANGLALSSAGGADAPLLHAAVVPLERRAAQAWAHRLLGTAAKQVEENASVLKKARGVDVFELLTFGIAQDYQELARRSNVTPEELPILASTLALMVMPVLHACATQLANRVPSHWSPGYCPVCGAWPALAEMRGLERARVLRCGRCASGWRAPVLLCPFCGERDHQQLGSLLPTVDNAVQHVAVCKSCNGYVKTVTTLQAVPAVDLMFEDLCTVELDLVAVERGYARPSEGFPLYVQFREPARRRFFGVGSP